MADTTLATRRAALNRRRADNRTIRNDRLIAAELQSHGGVCSCGCGAVLQPSAYHWHHKDETSKIEAISNLRRSTVRVLLAELSKCVPMLPACHLEGEHGH